MSETKPRYAVFQIMDRRDELQGKIDDIISRLTLKGMKPETQLSLVEDLNKVSREMEEFMNSFADFDKPLWNQHSKKI